MRRFGVCAMQSVAENESMIERTAGHSLSWGANEDHAEMQKVRQRLIEFEQKRVFKNEDLASLVQRNSRTSLHTAYEIKMFNKRYRRTNSGRQFRAAHAPVEPVAPVANPVANIVANFDSP